MLADPKNVEQAGDWYFASRPAKHPSDGRQFIAWCAKTANLGNNVMDVPIEVDCHFEYGATAEDAVRRLKAEVLN